MTKEYWTDKELNKIDSLTDNLINWMFHTPNNRYPIEKIIKQAILFGQKKEVEDD